jgi:multiple sugar transport system ATP-binding protein
MFVGGFIGTPPMNFVRAEIALEEGRPVARLGGATLPLRDDARGYVGREVVLGIRAESVEVETAPADGAVPATVVVVEPLGSHNLLTVRAGGNLLKVSVRPDLFPAPESQLWLRIAPDRIRWMDGDGGAAALGEEAEDVARSREALTHAQDAPAAL